MNQFRKIDDNFYASPQIAADEIAAAAKLGITTIVNNRPDGEDADQPEGDAIASEARSSGLNYVAIPVTHAGIGQGQVDAMLTALADAEGPVLAYCRSGTRSTMLWALAAAKRGDPPAVIASKAAQAGYDVSPIRQMIDMLSAGRTEG
ncbi:TIGR01244 family sulfur transferase [Croceicoccus hydrothermalis]|uniref:TIGR01244 family sulfur transferase n=1 Tax=Croceicoccus hydrothermalis TaxID=2867964 RepID=UPI001EFA634A|nr:TIGR01244 family sulfur transferase [Croceicoccus hydrothermalis]